MYLRVEFSRSPFSLHVSGLSVVTQIFAKSPNTFLPPLLHRNGPYRVPVTDQVLRLRSAGLEHVPKLFGNFSRCSLDLCQTQLNYFLKLPFIVLRLLPSICDASFHVFFQLV